MYGNLNSDSNMADVFFNLKLIAILLKPECLTWNDISCYTSTISNDRACSYKLIYHTQVFSFIQYNAMLHSALQHNAMQYNAIQYNTIQYNTMQYNLFVSNIWQNRYID